MRELVAAIREVETRARPPDRHPGRSAGAEAAGRQLRGRSGHARPRARPSSLDADPAPGDATRVHLPHPEIFAAHRARPYAPARRRQDPTCRDRGGQQAHRHARRGRRQAVGPQGREPARHHDAVLGADAEGPLRSRSRARRRHRLGGALLHPAPGRHRRGQEDHARPRRRDGQDREAAGGAPARRDPGAHRRADGGARRSRRRDAAREGAGHAEADDPHRRGAPASRSWSRPRCSNR